jgi:hypothetical protein
MRDARHHSLKQISEPIAAIVARYRTSGLALDRFAEQNGIPRGRLHYWVYQKQPNNRGGTRPKVEAAVAPVFQEVKLAGKPAPAAGLVEVSLPQGIAIRFSGAVTPDWISSVVQALQRPC